MEKKWWILIVVVVLIAAYFGFMSEEWEEDDIILMQHESRGFYGCFGCSEPDAENPLCLDPSPYMKTVEETSDRYCDSNFEIVSVACTEEAMVCADGSVVSRVGLDCEFEECPSEGVCSEESRNVDGCIEIYQPVCAEVRVECVTAPCDPVKETYSNSCFACQNERVDSFVVGEC